MPALRTLNQERIVDALRRNRVASRADLVRWTNLSRATVGSVVADLRANGLVVDAESEGDNSGDGSALRGRPPAVLRLAGSAGAAVGIDFGHRHLRVAAADLSSTILAERWMELDVDRAAYEGLDAASEMVSEVLRDAGFEHDQVVGVAMGLPGPVDRGHQTVGSSAILPGWKGVHPGAALERRLGVHVEVDNDANLGALGEVAFGAARGMSDVVFIKLASGIGTGLVLGGRIYRGAGGYAGELGHVNVRPDGALCRCGSRGCLETVAAEDALLEVLRTTEGPGLTVRGLLDAVARGDRGATRIVTDAGRSVGRVLADVCNLLDPEAIVVGGALSAAGEPLLAGIRESIQRHALPTIANTVEVLQSGLGERAEVLGAVALVIGDTDEHRSAGLASLRARPQMVLAGAT